MALTCDSCLHARHRCAGYGCPCNVCAAKRRPRAQRATATPKAKKPTGGGLNNRLKTECPQGHPLSGDNLYAYIGHDGYAKRACRACRSEAGKRMRAKKRGARNA
jgi:hypothetical protein